ncbi:Ig-like domain-containing protein [Mesorhizobium sp. CAU 1741]|uniref:Ig-like domain-containing protein n=1 Tax=Mesorhizobium sp. CAU 1741 TaxID=3140366 RepID=UPI00325AE9CE
MPPSIVADSFATDGVVNINESNGIIPLRFTLSGLVESGLVRVSINGSLSPAYGPLNNGSYPIDYGGSPPPDSGDREIYLTLESGGEIYTSNTLTYSYDLVRPTATLSLADTTLEPGETSQLTITFSEETTGLDLGDFTVENGTLSDLTTSDNINYSATFTPATGVTDTTNVITLAISSVVDASGNAGDGVATSDNYSVQAPLPPVNTVPASFSASEDVLLTIDGISIEDPDAGSAEIETKLSVTQGTLVATSGGSVTVTGGSDGAREVTLTGTAEDINAFIAAGKVAYQADANYSGPDTLTVRTDDKGATGGSAGVDTDTVAITVTAVNDDPVLSGLPGVSIPAVVGQSTALPDFTISDPDSADTLTLTLTATNGTISGLDDVDAVAAGIQLTGTPAQINAAIADATFTASATGTASIGLSVTDGVVSSPITGALDFSVTAQNSGGGGSPPTPPGPATVVTNPDGSTTVTLNEPQTPEQLAKFATPGIDTVVSPFSVILPDGIENVTLTGTGNISATGNTGDNRMTGNSGNNQFTGGGGNDIIDGGDGIDGIQLRGGSLADYDLAVEDGRVVFVDRSGADGTLQLGGIEMFNFADGSMISIAESEVGSLERTYEGLYGRLPDLGGINFWLDAVNDGVSLGTIANAFASSDEFANLYGSLDNLTFIETMYRNILDREGDAGGIEYYLDKLENGGVSRGDILGNFIASDEDIALAGQVSTSIEYI